MRFVLLGLIRLYKYCLSPLLPVACRFAPTCSDYAQEAITTHGAVKGSLLAARRMLRCHPWGRSGFDPVPCRCDKGTAHED
jgi:putative membrane protein insertion efficiency factor